MKLIVEREMTYICCIRLCDKHYKLLLINVYMPYESDATIADEFSTVLADVITSLLLISLVIIVSCLPTS